MVLVKCISAVDRPRYRSGGARRPPARRGAHRSRADRAGAAARAPAPAGAERRGRAVARRAAPVPGAVARGVRRGGRRGSACAATCPTDWSGRRVEAIVDLGFRADSPGLPVRGARARRRRASRCRASTRGARPCRSTPARAGRADRRGGVEPDVPAVPAVAARLAGDGRASPAVRVRPRRARCPSTPTPRRCSTTSTCSTA